MKKYLLRIALLALSLTPVWSIAAQSNTTARITLLQALAIVRADTTNIPQDAFIVDGSYDENDSCWKFEFSDLSEICISDTTGEIVEFDDDDDDRRDDAGIPAPAATEDADNGDNDDDVFAEEPTVSLDDAIATALRIFPNRIVTDFELERNVDGVVVWEVKLDDDTVRVEIDAETGFVIEFGRNNDDNDAVDDNSGRGNGSSDSDDDNGGDDNSGRGNGSSDSDNDNSGRSGGDDDNSGRGGGDD